MKRVASIARSVPRSVTLGATVVVVAGLYLAREVLIPITLAVLLAFLLNPLVARARRLGLSHVLAVSIVVVIALLGVLALAALFSMQIVDLIGDLPQYIENLQEKLRVIIDPVKRYFEQVTQSVGRLGADEAQVGVPAAQTAPTAQVSWRGEWISSLLMGFAAPVGTFAVVTVLAGTMLFQGGDLRDRIVRLVGSHQVSITTRALDDVSAHVSAYLVAQTTLNSLQGTVIAIGLLIIGVPSALFWALSWTLLRFLPYIGPWLGAIMPVLTSFGYFEGLTRPLATVALFVVVELIGNMILEPWFYGRRTGLSPLAVVVSAVFWTWLWGWVGLLLATPMTVCLAVLGRYVEPLEFLHILLSDRPVLRPSARLYQRLLSDKPDDARQVILDELQARGTVDVFQNTLVRALASVDEDRHRGWIDEAKADKVFADVKTILNQLPEPTDLPQQIVKVGTCLCLAVRDQADVLCGRMLQLLCQYQGIEVEVAESGYLASEKAELVAERRPDVVVVSALNASRIAFVRHTLRSLSSRSDAPAIVGIWHADESDLEPRPLDSSGPVWVTSFPEAIDAIRLAIHMQQTQTAKPRPPERRRAEQPSLAGKT